MLAHYKRSFDKDTKMPYMRIAVKEDELVERADMIFKERDRPEEMGCLPIRGRSAAPECMSAAFLLSILQKWNLHSSAQRRAGFRLIRSLTRTALNGRVIVLARLMLANSQICSFTMVTTIKTAYTQTPRSLCRCRGPCVLNDIMGMV
jgi:hypothetical protein